MKRLKPMKAIRAKCLDCSCYQPKEIRECPITKCALWPYRLGKRPKKEGPKELVTGDGED
jgi:hypothetical protein